MDSPNLDYIKEISDGDVEFENKLWAIIQEEFPIEKEKYYSSLNAKDQESMIEIVHKLKHKISILGLRKNYRNAVDYENSLRKGHSNLENEFKETLSVMSDFIESN